MFNLRPLPCKRVHSFGLVRGLSPTAGCAFRYLNQIGGSQRSMLSQTRSPGQVSSCNILFDRGSQDHFQVNRPTSAPNSLGTPMPRTTTPPRDSLRPPLPLPEWVNEDPPKICKRFETFFDGLYDNTSSGTLTFGVARKYPFTILESQSFWERGAAQLASVMEVTFRNSLDLFWILTPTLRFGVWCNGKQLHHPSQRPTSEHIVDAISHISINVTTLA